MTDKRKQTLKEEFNAYPELVSYIEKMDAKELKEDPVSFLNMIDVALSTAK